MVQDSRNARKKKFIDVLNKARSMGLFVIDESQHQHYNPADDLFDMHSHCEYTLSVSYIIKNKRGI